MGSGGIRTHDLLLTNLFQLITLCQDGIIMQMYSDLLINCYVESKKECFVIIIGKTAYMLSLRILKTYYVLSLTAK